MKNKFKTVFRILFLIISAIVFLFVFLPERCFGKNGTHKEKVVERKRKSILKKRVYYSKQKVVDEDCFEEIEDLED